MGQVFLQDPAQQVKCVSERTHTYLLLCTYTAAEHPSIVYVLHAMKVEVYLPIYVVRSSKSRDFRLVKLKFHHRGSVCGLYGITSDATTEVLF